MTLLASFFSSASLINFYVLSPPSHYSTLCCWIYMYIVCLCVPQDKEDLQLLLDDLRHSGGLVNGHSEEMKKWPIAKVCVCVCVCVCER